MKTYMGIFRMRMIAGFQYRAAAWAGVATQFFFGFVFISINKAFYDSTSTPQPISLDQLISYLWLQQAFLVIFAAWIQDNSLLDMIRTGNIAYELTRPISLYWMWYARLVAQRLSGAMMRCLPILAIAFFLPKPYNMQLPPNALAGGLFAISLPLALLLAVSMSMNVYVVALRILDAGGFRLVLNVVTEFFAGQVIALPLMPQWLQNIAFCLPFRYITDVPLRIYSGNIAGTEAYICIGLQVFWIAVATFGTQTMMQKNLKHVVVQGG